MGAGITVAFAAAGCSVALWTRRPESAERAAGQAASALADLAAHGLIDEESAAVLERIAIRLDASAAVKGAEFVVETVREDLGDKRALLASVAGDLDSDAVIASNTSSLSLDEIFAGTEAPERALGLHWFNPPELVDLVEVVPASATSIEVVERVRGWAEALGKQPVVVAVPIAGFVANRLQYALLREAYHLVAAGVCRIDDVDRAVVAGLGPRWSAVGPFESMDLAGLDVHLAVSQALFPELGTETVPAQILCDLVAAGDLGAKSGRGLRGGYDAQRLSALRDARIAALVASRANGPSG
jgi:3-hydroxybutyryl-CoA dehydrogenase